MSRGNPLWGRFERNAKRAFGEAAAKYLKEFDGKDKSRQVYCLESLDPYIGRLPIIDINGDALEAYKEDRREGRGAFDKPAMAATINRELNVVTAVLNRACRDWQWIPSVPRIRHVRGAEKRAYPLTWEEQDRVFKRLPESWASGAALFAVNTGVRSGELFGLKWSDMEVVPGLDTFVFILTGTKNGMDRAVICNSLARIAVDRQRGNGSRYVFPSRCGKNMGGRLKSYASTWKNAWDLAGMPSSPMIMKGMHNLRHTFAHRLRSAGVPQEDRDALLGHSNASLSQHYATPDIERLTGMAERVTERRDTVVLRAVNSAF